MYIKSLQIKDFKNYQDATVTFECLGGKGDLNNINLLLGVNGAGKTGILQACCLSILSGMLPNSGFVARNLVRRDATDENPETALLKADLINHYCEEPLHPVHIEQIRGLAGSHKAPGELFETNVLQYFLLGYGASRWVPIPSPADTKVSRDQVRHPRYQRVAGLFEQGYGLMPLESWIYELMLSSPQSFGQILDLVNQLLPDEIKLVNVLDSVINRKLKSDLPHITYERYGVKLPLHAYSDGYRAYISWINDLVFHLWVCTPDHLTMDQVHGVVLIDEVDLHLHPTWSQRILRKLSDNLPNLQFICTSHNPLVAGSLETKNLIRVTTNEKGIASIEKPEHSPLGLDADQVLKSKLFGMESTRAKAYQDLANDLYQKVLAGDQNAALDLMRLHSGGAEAIDVAERKPFPSADPVSPAQPTA